MRGRHTEAWIQRQSPSDDFTGTGGDWFTFAEVFADVRPLRGRELFNAQQVQSQVTHSIETEFIDNVTSKMRVKVAKVELVNVDVPEDDANFRLFEIESVVNVGESNRSLEMLVIEKT